MSGKKKKRDPLFGGSWFAYLLLALLAIAAAQSVFSLFQPQPPVYQQPPPMAPMQSVQRGEIEVLSDAPPPTRDSGYDDWLPAHMAPTATAQAEALNAFQEKYPDYEPVDEWRPPDNLPTVTPIPENAVPIYLPAPQWGCECISGVCDWAEMVVVGVYAYGIPDENGVIDMRDYLVGTPGARPEGSCLP